MNILSDVNQELHLTLKNIITLVHKTVPLVLESCFSITAPKVSIVLIPPGASGWENTFNSHFYSKVYRESNTMKTKQNKKKRRHVYTVFKLLDYIRFLFAYLSWWIYAGCLQGSWTDQRTYHLGTKTHSYRASSGRTRWLLHSCIVVGKTPAKSTHTISVSQYFVRCL